MGAVSQKLSNMKELCFFMLFIALIFVGNAQDVSDAGVEIHEADASSSFNEQEKLPRKEKALLGIIPQTRHTIYNPRARQPLTPHHYHDHDNDAHHHDISRNHHHDQSHDHHHDQSHDHHHDQSHEVHERHYAADSQSNEKSENRHLLRFPFEATKEFDERNELYPESYDVAENDVSFQNLGPLEKATIDKLELLEVDDTGRKCVNKVMMREETEYDEVLTCDHSYDKRCHDSYVTKYEPHQEEECEEKFRKVCTIEYEQKANQEVVEVCTASFVPDCDIEGEKECRTVYSSQCSTVQIVHEVEDDIANCETIEEEQCKEVADGFRTQAKCDVWPVEKCTIEKKKVKKYTPETSCEKVPQEACSPPGCGIKEGPVNCQDKVKTVISENPVELCDMEPLRTCKHVTKLVPKLETVQECVDVPKEICAHSKVNPRKVKKPAIQKWCFTPKSA